MDSKETLKTLKDLEKTYDGIYEDHVGTIFEEIKQEAIKWVKAMEKTALKKYNYLKEIQLNAFREFFKINDEDLKW